MPDVTTKKGRDAIASIAHKVARSKTALDNIGKELVAELKDVPKKIDAERKRIADEAAAVKAEEERREADKAHKGRINRAALKALIEGGLTEEDAKMAITLIAMGKIPSVRISY